MSSVEDFKYIKERLLPEFQGRFEGWHREYRTQERDLGERGEFVSFWRKAKKVKAIVWDGADPVEWREGLRIILFEIVAHALLMICDLDRTEKQEESRVRMAMEDPEEAEVF